MEGQIKTTIRNLLLDGERISTYFGKDDNDLGAIDGIGGLALHEVLLELETGGVAERAKETFDETPTVIWTNREARLRKLGITEQDVYADDADRDPT